MLVEQRVSVVVDTSLLSKGAGRRLAAAFVREMYHYKSLNRTPMHLVFDEADELAPQQPHDKTATLLRAMEDLIRRGRIRGIGATLVTQRPAPATPPKIGH